MRFEYFFKSVIIALFMASFGLSQSVRESFDYAPDILDGLGDAVDGWGGPWTIFAGSVELMSIEAGSLEYPGVSTSGNFLMGRMLTTDNDQRAYRELETTWPDNGTPYWISYLMQIENFSSSDQSWQGVSLYLNDGTELVLFGKVWGQPNLGLMAHTLGGGATVSPMTWMDGLVWTVIRIDMSGDDQNEPCYMWFNPDPVAEPDTAIADVKADIQMNDGFERVVAHYGRLIDIEVYFDEIRLGTSFEDVSSPYTSVRQHKNQIPNQFELSQNYPNPFNPTTTIAYDLKENGPVRLSVYDLAGHEVAVLVDGVLSAGSHQIEFDGADLTSGIFFYKLQTAEKAITRKMTLVK